MIWEVIDRAWRRRRAKAALKAARYHLSHYALRDAEEAIERALACGGDVLDAGELAAARAEYTRRWTTISVKAAIE